MDVPGIAAGVLTGAVVSWPLAWAYVASQVDRSQAQLRAEARFWYEQARHARNEAARLAEQAEAWAAGREAGSEEVLGVLRALTVSGSSLPERHS
jgi:hypothetical protein